MSAAKATKQPAGRVVFVGSGPGDPGLLTVRAAEVIAAADVVVHDTAVAEAVLAGVPESARVVQVTPKKADDALKAAVEAAKGGSTVVRLVVGDPVADGALAVEGPVVARGKVTLEVQAADIGLKAGDKITGIAFTLLAAVGCLLALRGVRPLAAMAGAGRP